MSQTGTSVPIKLPEWITGRSFVALGDTEGQSVLGMRVHHRHDIRPRLEDRRMYEALEIEACVFVTHRLPVEAELDDIFGGDQFWSERARDQKCRRDRPGVGR